MIEEVWRDIKNYEGLYQVSSLGRVKSLKRKDSLGRPVKERILRPAPTTMGYLMVVLCTGGNKKKLGSSSISLPSISQEHREQNRCQSYQ